MTTVIVLRTGRVYDCSKHGQQAGALVNDDEMCVKCMRDLRVADGWCACGCGESLWRRAANVKFVRESHKYVARRQDLKWLAEALGVPSAVTAKSLTSVNPTANRGGNAQTSARAAHRASSKPRRPALRISYRKALDALTAGVYELMPGAPREFAAQQATRILAPLLTDRQKEAL